MMKQPAIDHLSIRSYSQTRRGHSHTFNQLVLPLQGVINIELDGYSGKVSPGECVIIHRDVIHHFTAAENARFVVADLQQLPNLLQQSETLVFSISEPLNRYLGFVEQQLQQQANEQLEQLMLQTFCLLLQQQTLLRQLDSRIRAAQFFLNEHLADDISIDSLAAVACLSTSQFKKLFRQQIGQSVMQFLRQQRMERAKALLVNTDYPVQLVAERVGYQDVSAFSRRFNEHFGLKPSEIAKR